MDLSTGATGWKAHRDPHGPYGSIPKVGNEKKKTAKQLRNGSSGSRLVPHALHDLVSGCAAHTLEKEIDKGQSKNEGNWVSDSRLRPLIYFLQNEKYE